MSYKAGDLVTGTKFEFGVPVWKKDLTQAVDVLNNGEYGIVLAENGMDWLEIMTPRGRRGWIFNEQLRIIARSRLKKV